jgi:hypothetical protein
VPITIAPISMSEVNTHLSASSTAQRSMNDTGSRNIANKGSGAISFRDLRFGINFPAWDIEFGSGGTAETDANTTNMIYIFHDLFDLGPPGDAGAEATFFNDGTGNYTNASVSILWLPAGMGSAADHYVRWEAGGDTGLLTGSSINTDLQMNTTRFWTLTVPGPVTPGSAFGSCSGPLIIKDSGGTEYFRRTLELRGSAVYL